MYVHIGEVIRDCRIRKGWSKNQLSKYSRVGRSTLYRIESTGKGNIDNIEQLLGAMGYELEVVPRSGQ